MQGVVISMEKTLQELADFLHGTLENEDPALRITGGSGAHRDFICHTAVRGVLP